MPHATPDLAPVRVRGGADPSAAHHLVTLRHTKSSVTSVRDNAARIIHALGARIRHSDATLTHGYAAGTTARQARRIGGRSERGPRGSGTGRGDPRLRPRAHPPSRGPDRIDQRDPLLDHRPSYVATTSGSAPCGIATAGVLFEAQVGDPDLTRS
ncbi:hypothetical protein NX794_20610 [Streptomyces sp. LP11]|uniref:Uncharacterized protein n=1 Tax=Streptomyces pyxinicus TaxID=2970331 RepID=A0ABT2B4Z9_9ACTN|nr:hypothetical protein [Streptomyces sp. LP11]MCS0603597.1 hypothetical protein [Streptomyces sp. LP11]